MAQQTQTLKFKSTRTEGNIVFVRPGEMSEGEAVQGEYVAALPSKFDENKKDFKLEEVDDTGAKTGKTIIVNAGGNLGSRMADISLGSLVRIVYLGKTPIKKGKMAGKLSHNFDVETAE